MSNRERQRLADIQAAIDAIRSHLQRGDLTDGLIFDAVRIRLPIRSALNRPGVSGLTGAIHSGSPTLLWVCGVTPTGCLAREVCQGQLRPFPEA